jgi:hypothetical protein
VLLQASEKLAQPGLVLRQRLTDYPFTTALNAAA